MRTVLDTNVLLSAALGGRTRAVLTAVIARRFELVTSNTLLEELANVLGRAEWQHALSPRQRRELLTIIGEAATIVSPTHHVTACRDPEDNALLDCAIAGEADYLVTGDNDLLSLRSFQGTRILRPSEFLRLLP